MTEFVDAILRFNAKAIDNAERVLKGASQNLFFDVLKPVGEGGRMRIDTGFLRASARVTLDAPDLTLRTNPAANRPKDQKGQVIFALDAPIGLTINNARLGQTLYMTFTANYARYREYGTKFQPADAFVRTHTAMWQQYVDEEARRIANE